MQHRLISSTIALAVVAGVSAPASAVIVLNNGDSASLATLLAAGSDRKFMVGDKLFTLESYTSSQFNPAQFSVVGFIAGGPQPLPNIGFDIIGPFGDGSPGDLIVHEMNVQYTVEISPAALLQNPLLRIKDTVLTFNGSASGDGSYTRVDESVFDFIGNVLLGTPAVYAIAGPPPSALLQDSLIFLPGYTKLEINKDMKFFAAHVNDGATMSFVRQEFSQIPSPGVMATLGLGVLVIGRRRR